MEKIYGYNPLSYELINLFRSGRPNFVVAEELISKGADVNDQGEDKDENVLSEILMGYWQSATGDYTQKVCLECSEGEYYQCAVCEKSLNPNVGKSMIEIIKFFLEHGFDVMKQEGDYGKACLRAIALSTFDRTIIEATKIMLAAYGENMPVFADDNDDESPLWVMRAESGGDGDIEKNNIYYAGCKIYEAIASGRPYMGIDSYETAVGKKIISVMAEPAGDGQVIYAVDVNGKHYENCYANNVYFVFDDGYLIISPFVKCWVDTVELPNNVANVSERFDSIMNHHVQQIDFSTKILRKENMMYLRDTIHLRSDNDITVNFTSNWGSAENGQQCSYFYYNK